MSDEAGAPHLLFERRGHVGIATFNRPRVMNAMSPEVVCRLVDTFEAFATDPALRVLVLTGAGETAFSSGGDLALTLPLLTGARVPEDAWDRRLVEEPGIMARSTLKGVALDKPVIAAVNGACLAGGLELMLATDIRIAAPHAMFGLPEPKRGLIPFAGALVRLPRQIPHAFAMEMLLTGEPIRAADALRFGLVNRVVAAEEVLPAAVALAERIADNGPVAVREIKRTVRISSGIPFEAAYAVEDQSMATVMASRDAREGPRAFMEKRRAVYEGR